MADGSIRIGIEFDKSKAKKGTNDLVKETENAIKGLEKITKNMTISYDTEGAKKQLKSLDKVIENSQKKAEQAKSSFASSYKNQIAEAEQSVADYQKKIKDTYAAWKAQGQAIERLEADLDEMQKTIKKHSSSLASQDRYVEETAQAIEKAKVQQEQLAEEANKYYNNLRQAEKQTANLKASPKAADGYKEMTSQVKTYENAISDAKDEQKDIYKGLNKAKTHATRLATAMTGAKKSTELLKKATNSVIKGTGKLVKTVSKSLVNGIKKAVSKFKNMGNSVESVRKKTLKIGLALIGMRGALGMLRKAVSSALSDNEELQNQLTAIKGMMGQALAPAIQVLLNGLSQLITFADKLYQVFAKTSLIAKYNAKQTEKTAKSTKKASKSAKEYNRQMASFDVANTLSDNGSSDKASDEAEEIANLFKPAKMKKWMQDIIKAFKKGNWKEVGSTIAKSINNALAKINWKSIQNKVKNFTTALGEAMNGFVGFLDWNLLGKTFANALNTITTAITNFVDTVDWDTLGGKIATSLSSLVATLNPKDFGKSLTSGLKILTELLYGFFNGKEGKSGFDFAKFGEKVGNIISSALKNIPWDKVAKNAASAINGLFTFLNSTIAKLKDKDLHIGQNIAEKLLTFLSEVDWGEIGEFINNAITGMCNAISDFFKRLDENDDAYNTVVDGIEQFFKGLKLKEIIIALGEMILNVSKFSLKFTSNATKDTWNALSKWIKDISANFDFEFWDKPKLAKGGIVNNPGRGVTATVGEAGAEAVLPLENNTDWMDALADKLAQKIGAGDITVMLKLDSKTLSKEVVKATNRRAYLTGGRA